MGEYVSEHNDNSSKQKQHIARVVFVAPAGLEVRQENYAKFFFGLVKFAPLVVPQRLGKWAQEVLKERVEKGKARAKKTQVGNGNGNENKKDDPLSLSLFEKGLHHLALVSETPGMVRF